uniref:GDNF/GAS1 domain-containing protein n=1 Tax=Tetraodon nigroviridis TaxID=99883 RepID=H3CEC3_TETNG
LLSFNQTCVYFDLFKNLRTMKNALSGPGAQAEWVDCIQASEMCNQNPNCSSRYRVMRQCLVGKEKDAMLDNNRECQAALEVLLLSPLYDCRCKRGMKKELQCLQNYWTIHMGLGEGGDMDESSPYEPVAPNRHPDAFRLASISSGIAVSPRNVVMCSSSYCCQLNSSLSHWGAEYEPVCSVKMIVPVNSCSKVQCPPPTSPFISHWNTPMPYLHPYSFSSCVCRWYIRVSVVPSTIFKSYPKACTFSIKYLCVQKFIKHIVNITNNIRTFYTRVEEFPVLSHQVVFSPRSLTGGTDMTPNYVDNSFSNWTISPWCTCEGSGNQEEACYNFLRFFTDNTCLNNAFRPF